MKPGFEPLLATALAVALLVLTTAVHCEGLKSLSRPRSRPGARPGPVFVLPALVALHLAEIGFYAAAYAAGVEVLGLGALHRAGRPSVLDYFCLASQTYSTLGYGDVVPTGALRMIASVEPLNGLLLLAWSGSFLFRHLDGSRK